MVLDGKEADNDDNDAAEEGVELGREAEEAVAAYIDDAAGDAGHGVDLLAKDEGHLVDEDVADDSACGPGDAAHGDGSPEGEAHLESLLDADDVEEGKANGVEDEPGVLLADEVLAEDDDPEEGDEAADDVDAVGEPEGTDAKHEVAYGAAADGCGHAYDEGSEPVETLGGCHADAGDGEGHGADELDDDEGGGDAQAEGELLQEVEHDAGRGGWGVIVRPCRWLSTRRLCAARRRGLCLCRCRTRRGGPGPCRQARRGGLARPSTLWLRSR